MRSNLGLAIQTTKKTPRVPVDVSRETTPGPPCKASLCALLLFPGTMPEFTSRS